MNLVPTDIRYHACMYIPAAVISIFHSLIGIMECETATHEVFITMRMCVLLKWYAKLQCCGTRLHNLICTCMIVQVMSTCVHVRNYPVDIYNELVYGEPHE